MAYDAARQEVVLFGGAGPVEMNDTWVWNGVNWTQEFPVTSPPTHSSHVMAYDAARQRVVLFGGSSRPLIVADTWEWDGVNWTQRFPATSPSPRLHAGMAYDAARQRVVLFGGGPGSPTGFADTWVWDGTDWIQEFPATSPPARSGHALAYDTVSGQVVLFGGTLDGVTTFFNDTWIWDGTTWTQKFPAMSPTTPRSYYRVAYDATRHQVVLFGGQGPSNNPLYDDTWVWDGVNWAEKLPANRPPGRTLPALAYDEVRRQMVLFGGFTGSFANDTWVFSAVLRFVDPHKALHNGGDLASLAETWATSADTVHGVVADGTTRVVVRIPAETFTLADLTIQAEDGLGGDIGALQTLQATGDATMLSLSPIHTSTGDYFMGVYRSPDDFVRAGLQGIDGPALERFVTLKVTITDSISGALPAVEVQIKIVRPPVVLLHGIFSSANNAFSGPYRESIKANGKRIVYAHDYSVSNHLELPRNVIQPQKAISIALDLERDAGIAATRADVLAHSMGGLLTRLYIQNPSLYRRADNFYEGDVNRLIGIDSPHLGTPLSDVALEMADACAQYGFDCNTSWGRLHPLPNFQRFWCGLLKFFECSRPGHHPNAINGGAMADMRSAGPRISILDETDVPSHALVSDASGSALLNGLWESAFWVLAYSIMGHSLPPLDDFFCRQGHDAVVPLLSQRGGIVPGATSPLSANMGETLGCWKFNVEGEAGMTHVYGYDDSRGEHGGGGEGEPATVFAGREAADSSGGGALHGTGGVGGVAAS